MLQNIKVDIIYYLTQTDFEMEFNLCGCCRMRLLTDKVSDRKEFIHSLSRAVSRSRVIICCGSLFGETGLIKGVAAAIGKNVVNADNSAYGIQDGGDIGIIDGSMPLVTPEGIFGGCIIESGPQAIILLSESKNIRKSIMNSLIHPYIEELSISPVAPAAKTEPAPEVAPVQAPLETENAAEADVPAETAEEATEETAEEATEETAEETSTKDEQAVTATAEPEQPEQADTPEEAPATESDQQTDAEETEQSAAEETEQSAAEETNAEAEQDEADAPSAEGTASMNDMLIATMESGAKEDPKSDNAPLPDVESEKFELYIEPKQVKYSKKHYYDVDYDAGAFADELFAEPETDNSRLPFRTPILILTIILLLALAVLAYILIFIPLSKGYSFTEYISMIFSTASIGIRPH